MSDLEPEPTNCIVCIEPEERTWAQTLCQGPKGLFLKFLSDGITWADEGRYSHNTLKNGSMNIDARLSAGVSMWYYGALVGLGRTLGFYVYADREPNGADVLELVWATITAGVQVPYPLPGPVVEEANNLVDDPASFSLFGLVRLGVILLQRGRRLGRWLTNRRRDSPGFFCSELIAKGFTETEGVDLVVLIEPSRIPEDAKARRAIVEAMVARSQPFVGTAAASPEVFAAQLDAIDNVPIGSDGRTPLTVGYWVPGAVEPLFPPVLVTPNDLARSPSLTFVGSVNGVIPPEEHDSIDPDLWSRRGRATRMVLWGLLVVVAAVIAVVALVVLGRVQLSLRDLGVGALIAGAGALFCWRARSPLPVEP